MLDGPPPLWASGNPSLGNPRYRPSAPAFGAFAAAVGPALRRPRRPLHPLERAEPAAVDPAAGRLRQEALHAGRRPTPIARWSTPRTRPSTPSIPPPPSSSARSRPPAATSRAATPTCARSTFLRALGCLDAKLRPVTTGGCRGFQPALADGFAYHPHSTRNPPDQPFAHPDNADLGEPVADRAPARPSCSAGAASGARTTPLGLWLDEYGYQTNPPDKLRGVSPGRQDRYLQQAAYIAWRDPRVQLLSQYLWSDEPVGGGKRYTGWQSGLHDADGEPKPALAHFDHPIWLDFASSTLWGQVRPGGVHAVQVQVRVAGAGDPVGAAGRRHDRRATATGRCAPR